MALCWQIRISAPGLSCGDGAMTTMIKIWIYSGVLFIFKIRWTIYQSTPHGMILAVPFDATLKSIHVVYDRLHPNPVEMLS